MASSLGRIYLKKNEVSFIVILCCKQISGWSPKHCNACTVDWRLLQDLVATQLESSFWCSIDWENGVWTHSYFMILEKWRWNFNFFEIGYNVALRDLPTSASHILSFPTSVNVGMVGTRQNTHEQSSRFWDDKIMTQLKSDLNGWNFFFGDKISL